MRTKRRFWVEQATDGGSNPWLVIFQPRNGEPEITSEHATKSAARGACDKAIEEYCAIDAAEQLYQAQYAYACGYYD